MRRTSAPGQPLSPETWALLACAQAVVDERRLPAFREAVASCTSAERLCSAAVQHGMVGHLHRLIGTQRDPSFAAFVAEPLAKLYRTSMQRNLHQAAELLRLLERLRDLGVEAMPIKGPALAEALYGDVTLRNWVDLDLVVRHEQVAAARQALLDVGFRDDSPHNERLLLRRERSVGRIHMRTDDGDLRVDIHWRVHVGRAGAHGFSGETLLSHACALQLLGRDVRSPGADDMMLITAMEGARDRWSRLETCLSLGVQVRDMPASAWPRLLEAADEIGCRRNLVVGVAHTCRVLAFNVPPEIAAALALDCVARALLHSLRPGSLEQASGNSQLGLTPLWWTFATEDTWLSAVRHATEHATRPYTGDWEAIALPEASERLYYLLRPLRLALKWARRLI